MIESDSSTSEMPRDPLPDQDRAGGLAESVLAVFKAASAPSAQERHPFRFVVPGDWVPAEGDDRFVAVARDDDAMAPVLPPGAFVGYSAVEESPSLLDGHLVVAWIDGEPVVRRLEFDSGAMILRALKAEHHVAICLDPCSDVAHEPVLRRVIWIASSN